MAKPQLFSDSETLHLVKDETISAGVPDVKGYGLSGLHQPGRLEDSVICPYCKKNPCKCPR